MRIAMICALGAWLALVVLQEALAARERSRLQRQAEAQERMWRNARDMQMRHWEEIGRKHDELDQQAGVLRDWEAELADKEQQLSAQQKMLEELAKQIVTTRAPASPKALPLIIISTAPSASSSVMATTTPLPAARPSALTTTGAPWRRI